jgi:hypothetical protein
MRKFLFFLLAVALAFPIFKAIQKNVVPPVVDEVKKDAKKAGDAIQDEKQKVGDAVEGGKQNVKGAIEGGKQNVSHAGHSVVDGAVSAVHKVEHGIVGAGQASKEKVVEAGSAAKGGVEKLADKAMDLLYGTGSAQAVKTPGLTVKDKPTIAQLDGPKEDKHPELYVGAGGVALGLAILAFAYYARKHNRDDDPPAVNL